ncbi:hypothetical protein DF186_14910, partial [Enterococcus hirae]
LAQVGQESQQLLVVEALGLQQVVVLRVADRIREQVIVQLAPEVTFVATGLFTERDAHGADLGLEEREFYPPALRVGTR